MYQLLAPSCGFGISIFYKLSELCSARWPKKFLNKYPTARTWRRHWIPAENFKGIYMNERCKSKDTCSPSTRKHAMHACITTTVIKGQKLITTPCMHVQYSRMCAATWRLSRSLGLATLLCWGWPACSSRHPVASLSHAYPAAATY
jgi:hypothetical protein